MEVIIKALQPFIHGTEREVMVSSSTWTTAATCTAAAGLAVLAIAQSRDTPFYYHARRGPPVAGHAESFGAIVVSPQGHALRRGDSYSTSIPLRRLRPGITDGEILARFTCGFFGGPMFTPERYFFAVSDYQVTDVDGMNPAFLSPPRTKADPGHCSLTSHQTGCDPCIQGVQ